MQFEAQPTADKYVVDLVDPAAPATAVMTSGEITTTTHTFTSVASGVYKLKASRVQGAGCRVQDAGCRMLGGEQGAGGREQGAVARGRGQGPEGQVAASQGA